MVILDWRPRVERILLSLWRRQGGAKRLKAGERFWQAIHDRAIEKRVARRQVPPAKPLIVSVGNLSLGGTGKTPVVISLAQDLAARGHRGVVLTRGYKSPLAGPLIVSAQDELAGDEARLLASALGNSEWAVVQARSRFAGLEYILAMEKTPDLVILEDGHQTAQVGRHLDILILDQWAVTSSGNSEVVPNTGAVFPGGPWRESSAGAKRAEVWLLETAQEWPDHGVGGSVVMTFGREFSLAAANSSGSVADSPVAPMLVSGIARPEKFEAGAQTLLESAAILAVRLADHSYYDADLVQRLRKEMERAGCDAIITTDKDWIKLAPLWPADTPAYTVSLDITWGIGRASCRERV